MKEANLVKSEKVAVIIPAAGFGKRMGTSVSKQYIRVDGKPILAYTLEPFEICSKIDEIILVVGQQDIESVQKDIVNAYGIKKVRAVIAGGDERRDSVYKGLGFIDDAISIVMVHDGARPMITTKLISDLVDETICYPACVLGVKVKDTIKKVDNNRMVIDTPDRDALYQIQTPQSFKRELIQSAYEMGVRDGFKATDDAMMIEKYSDVQVKIIEGSSDNRKITTPEDLKWMKYMLK